MQLILIDTSISAAECVGIVVPVIPAVQRLRQENELHLRPAWAPQQDLASKTKQKTTCLKPKEVVRDLNHDLPVNEAWFQFPKMLIFDCTLFEHSFSGPQMHFLL